MSEKNKFIQGYVCAVACLVNSHGSFVEAKDLLTNIGNLSIETMRKKGCDEYDIQVLVDNGLIE